MIDSAPHLTNKISIVLPSTNPFQTIYYYAGMVMYYLIYAFCHPATGTKFNFPYFLNWGDLKSIFPSISQKYISGIVY